MKKIILLLFTALLGFVTGAYSAPTQKHYPAHSFVVPSFHMQAVPAISNVYSFTAIAVQPQAVPIRQETGVPAATVNAPKIKWQGNERLCRHTGYYKRYHFNSQKGYRSAYYLQSLWQYPPRS